MIFNLNSPTEDADKELLANNMRYYRDRILAESDWTQMPDSPLTVEQRQAWATYRQALRDFPSTWTPGPEANFPDPPEGN